MPLVPGSTTFGKRGAREGSGAGIHRGLLCDHRFRSWRLLTAHEHYDSWLMEGLGAGYEGEFWMCGTSWSGRFADWLFVNVTVTLRLCHSRKKTVLGEKYIYVCAWWCILYCLPLSTCFSLFTRPIGFFFSDIKWFSCVHVHCFFFLSLSLCVFGCERFSAKEEKGKYKTCSFFVYACACMCLLVIFFLYYICILIRIVSLLSTLETRADLITWNLTSFIPYLLRGRCTPPSPNVLVVKLSAG